MAALVGLAVLPPAARSTEPASWPAFGNGPSHTFSGPTSITPAQAPTLAPRWYFPTNEIVTAEPIVANGTVYVGSWDGVFHAIDAATGTKKWEFTAKPQPAVTSSALSPDHVQSDGGMITGGAWYEASSDLVIFGAGYTLYALHAATGVQAWSIDLTGKPEAAPDPANDETRLFSSPVVVDGKVVVGVSADGQDGERGYVAAVDVSSGALAWRFETDVDGSGNLRNDGCGNVWTSPTVVGHRVVVGVADCNFFAGPYLDERVIAVDVDHGTLEWKFTPPRVAEGDPDCDWDFGATANAGPDFLGIGGKDGTYYSLDPASGTLRWQKNVVFGGLAGGFISPTAYDGTRAYGATAIGDFGRFEGFGSTDMVGCEVGNPANLPVQEPSMHAFDKTTGAVVWQAEASQTLGPTTVAGGMTFVAGTVGRDLQVRDAATGTLLAAIPLPAPSDSGATPVGNALFLGTGSAELAAPAGVWAYTPLGAAVVL